MVNIQIKSCTLQWGSWKSRQVEPGGFEEMERYSIIIVGKKFFWDVGSFFHIIWHDMIWRLKCGIIPLSLLVTRFWWWMWRFWLCRGRRRGGGKGSPSSPLFSNTKGSGWKVTTICLFRPPINPLLKIHHLIQTFLSNKQTKNSFVLILITCSPQSQR